jgi:23S rRNA pseudouridine955/2504/2580 synthase
MFLHAWRLQFQHPSTGEAVALEAPLPSDLQRFADLHASTAAPL